MTETLNREYFTDGLPLSIVNCQLSTPSHAISFDADTIANALVNIYQKKYGNGRDLEPTLFEKTKEILGGAVNKGWNAGGSPATDKNSAFIDALRHNTDVFSAFRTHKMQSKIAAQLLDSKGKLKPFGQFVKDVKPYVTELNRAQLQTEYDTAVLRAHQAADWKQFEDEKDVFPNLEWLPSTSPHPGEDHRPYWGTVLPIDHKFWNEHRPGDRWNCKCRLRNTDKEPTAVPAETLVKNLKPSKGLESNPGKTGEIFSNKHPYFPENCGKCPFNKGVGRLFAALVGKGKHCGDCQLMNKVICEEGYTPPEDKRPKKRTKFIKKGKEYNKEWECVFECEESGGYIAIENGHGTGEKTQNINSAIPLAKDGHAVELIKQTKIKKPDGKKEWITTRDANVDGERWEFKKTSGYTNLASSISTKASEVIRQGADVLLVDIVKNDYYSIKSVITGVDNAFYYNTTLLKVCVMLNSKRYLIVEKEKWLNGTFRETLEEFFK